MKSLRERASGNYAAEIAIVQMNISALLLGMKQRIPDYWPILMQTEPGSTKTHERYSPLIWHHRRLLAEMPEGMKMGKEILEKVWPGDFAIIEEKM